jgi:hypothetical protein
MTRCTNCGAEIRPGAKFCTSCGFRVAASDAPVTPARSPFATTSSTSWTETVIAPPPPPEPPPAPASVVEETVIEVEDTRSQELEMDENERPGPSWYAPVEASTTGPVSDEMVAALDPDASSSSTDRERDEEVTYYPVDGDRVQGEDADVPAPQATAPETPDEAPGIASAESGEVDATEPDRTAEMPPVVSAPVRSLAGSDDPLGEARDLAARLQGLLEVAAARSGGAAAQRVALTADEDEVQALRRVIQAAQERPRDVDVMLDLVLRADTIAAVLDDRAALLAAHGGGGASGGTAEPAADPTASWPSTAE